MPKPTINERVRELRELESKLLTPHRTVDWAGNDYDNFEGWSRPEAEYCAAAGKHMPAILDALERQRKAAWAFGKTVEGVYGYLQHDVHCEIEPTDYCTCGLREAKQAVHDAWEALNEHQ